MRIAAEYVWIDGQQPTAKLRSKTKIIAMDTDQRDSLAGNVLKDVTNRENPLPRWGFDGSSTEQAKGNFSDCMLLPIRYVFDPIRDGLNVAVMCEVMNPDGTPHVSNTRAKLRELVEKYKSHEPLFGIEQEYTLYDGLNDWPFGWPKPWPKVLRRLNRIPFLKKGYPPPQGRYYCGVGYDEVHGRPLVEAHRAACRDAGLSISGINAEVMPAQWEFQVGPLDSLAVGDQLWLARWFLYRLGEDYNAYAKLDPKPMSGDWNGAGGHTNFSTKAMREDGGIKAIHEACDKLGNFHKQHIAVYGAHNDKRLTGKHETCGIDQFRWGVSDRGASIRVPMETANSGKGYLEDRRPAANADPYKVCTVLLETVCGEGFDPAKYNW